MENTLDSLPVDSSGRITCGYRNETSRLQIVRIANVPNWYFERVVFPGQQLIFQSFPEAVLEVHSSESATTILRDRFSCAQLRCAEPIQLPASQALIQA